MSNAHVNSRAIALCQPESRNKKDIFHIDGLQSDLFATCYAIRDKKIGNTVERTYSAHLHRSTTKVMVFLQPSRVWSSLIASSLRHLARAFYFCICLHPRGIINDGYGLCLAWRFMVFSAQLQHAKKSFGRTGSKQSEFDVRDRYLCNSNWSTLSFLSTSHSVNCR